MEKTAVNIITWVLSFMFRTFLQLCYVYFGIGAFILLFNAFTSGAVNLQTLWQNWNNAAVCYRDHIAFPHGYVMDMKNISGINNPVLRFYCNNTE